MGGKKTLGNGKIAISSKELKKTNKMRQMFKCGTMQDYHYCYLKLDLVLLLCCSEYCRKLSYQTNRLDVVQVFSAPNMAKDPAFRTKKARVELVPELEHLHMVELSVRRGITSVFETRYFKTDN